MISSSGVSVFALPLKMSRFGFSPSASVIAFAWVVITFKFNKIMCNSFICSWSCLSVVPTNLSAVPRTVFAFFSTPPRAVTTFCNSSRSVFTVSTSGDIFGMNCPRFPFKSVTVTFKLSSNLFAFSKSGPRSEEHTSELQSHHDLVCRLLLEKKKKKQKQTNQKKRTRIPHKQRHKRSTEATDADTAARDTNAEHRHYGWRGADTSRVSTGRTH